MVSAVVVMVLVAAGIPVIAAEQAMTDADKTFVKNAASGGRMEVELGQMAQTKAKSQQVRDFGARMVKDHGKANDELKKLVRQKGMSVPENLELKHNAMVVMLKPLPAEQFDKQYMQHMVSDHMKDVAEFRQALQTVTDPDLKGWAEKTLPVLEKHLQLAKEVATKVGVDQEKIDSKTGK